MRSNIAYLSWLKLKAACSSDIRCQQMHAIPQVQTASASASASVVRSKPQPFTQAFVHSIDPAVLQGAKLQYGGVPLYVRGEDDKARQYRSLHSVQRHMIDTNQCKMIYDDNEEEYEEYYDYEAEGTAEEPSTSGDKHTIRRQ